jgi:hypothetical protein
MIHESGYSPSPLKCKMTCTARFRQLESKQSKINQLMGFIGMSGES